MASAYTTRISTSSKTATVRTMLKPRETNSAILRALLAPMRATKDSVRTPSVSRAYDRRRARAAYARRCPRYAGSAPGVSFSPGRRGGSYAPAIMTSHSTSNSGSSRLCLKKRFTSPIIGNAFMSSFVSSTSESSGLSGMPLSSGRASMMKVSSEVQVRPRHPMHL